MTLFDTKKMVNIHSITQTIVLIFIKYSMDIAFWSSLITSQITSATFEFVALVAS